MSSLQTRSHLISGSGLKDAPSVRARVEQDIAFLKNRLEAMKRQSPGNQPVIDAYQTMLNSRIAVLNWLNHGGSETDPATA